MIFTLIVAARVVVCAQQQSPLAKAAAAGVSLPALLAAHPAFALVDDRLAGEGTGKIFGINDPALFWVLAVSTRDDLLFGDHRPSTP